MNTNGLTAHPPAPSTGLPQVAPACPASQCTGCFWTRLLLTTALLVGHIGYNVFGLALQPIVDWLAALGGKPTPVALPQAIPITILFVCLVYLWRRIALG